MPITVRVVKEQTFNDWAAALKARDKKKAKEIIRAIAVDLPDQTKIVADIAADAIAARRASRPGRRGRSARPPS